MKTEPNPSLPAPSGSQSQRRFSDTLQRPDAKDRVSNDRVSNDRVSNDRVSNDRVSNDRVSNDRVSNDRITKDRVSPASARQPAPPDRGPGDKLAGAVQARSSAKELVATGDRTTHTLKEARGRHQAFAETLVVRREELGERVQRGTEDRLLERVKQELDPDPGRSMIPAEPAPRAAPSSVQESRGGPTGVTEGGHAAGPRPARSSAASAVELVQKIEVWVKSSRPALSMTVGGTLAAEVTVERTGPGRVSLSLRGTSGPPAHSDVRALRDALEARGLQLTSVRIC